MDSSHVALVSLCLSVEGFEHYRCDKSMVLGINIGYLAKVMKLCDANDSVILKAEENQSQLKLAFEGERTKTEFTLNLTTIDVEHLAIPETDYSSIVNINAGEFSKICKELISLSETMTITTS